nr:MAG TPA: hypothetical protein [Caudoviricetes sp.]
MRAVQPASGEAGILLLLVVRPSLWLARSHLGIPLPLGCISLSSARSLAFGYSYPVAGGRLFSWSSVRQRARGCLLPPSWPPPPLGGDSLPRCHVEKIARLHSYTRFPLSLVQVATSHYDNATHLNR